MSGTDIAPQGSAVFVAIDNRPDLRRLDLGPMTPPPLEPCPCGSGRPYPQCCGPLHTGGAAPDAQSLMRSRYCAFVLCDERYLLATWHPSTRPGSVSFN